MAYWLLKTEPTEYAFAQLERDRRTIWDGVTNALARKHLRAMREGDEVFIYHTGNERAIVGVARVVKNPCVMVDAEGREEPVVEVEVREPLARRLSLAEIKASPVFADFDLLRLPRLSVIPVPPQLWRAVLELAGR